MSADTVALIMVLAIVSADTVVFYSDSGVWIQMPLFLQWCRLFLLWVRYSWMALWLQWMWCSVLTVAILDFRELIVPSRNVRFSLQISWADCSKRGLAAPDGIVVSAFSPSEGKGLCPPLFLQRFFNEQLFVHACRYLYVDDESGIVPCRCRVFVLWFWHSWAPIPLLQ